MSHFFEALAKNRTVKEAHFEMSEVDDRSAAIEERAARAAASNRSLSIGTNQGNAAALLSHGALTYLNLSGQSACRPEGLGALGLAVSKSRSLATLHLNEVTPVRFSWRTQRHR